jgi:hypothetical protein
MKSGNAKNAGIKNSAPSASKRAAPDDRAQSKRFLEAAREAEADETEEGADRAFKKIASSKPLVPRPRPSGRTVSS